MVSVAALLRDYAELTKARITTLIVLAAWCGYFFSAHKSALSAWSFGLLHALLGIALVSSGTAALNEVLEADVDSRMRRTAQRPIPAGRMSRLHAAIFGLALTVGGSLYLSFISNPLTGQRSCFCGSSHISYRSPGFIARTTRAARSACFRSWNQMEEEPCGESLLIQLRCFR